MGGGLTNKGFTLIELLAIIVILAIIAVITIPIILNIIENSRKGAAQDSAYGFKDSINKYYVDALSENKNLKLEGEYTISDGNLTGKFEGSESTSKTVTILVSGEKPSSGSLHYTNSVLDGGYLVIGDYKVTFNQDGKIDKTEKNTGSSSSNQSGGNNQQQNVESLEIGDSVNYSTTLNGVTLNNWKVFYVEGDYTYLIYGDYLPNAAIDTSNISGVGISEIYNIYAAGGNDYDIEQFHNSMKNSSYWNNLLKGILNDINIDYTETTDTNIYAMGTPTLDLWISSWNIVNPSETLYVEYIVEDGNKVAYNIGKVENPQSDHVELTSSSNLYLLSEKDSAWGYAVNSECTSWRGWFTVEMNVYEGNYAGTNYFDSNYDSYSIRPVIKLPTSILNQ